MFLAALGTEESTVIQQKSWNEFLFQMQAMMNIVLNAYEAKKIVTACPIVLILEKWISRIRRKYEVVHHTEFFEITRWRKIDNRRRTILKENELLFMIHVI
jgi:Fe-S oxidoreductase